MDRIRLEVNDVAARKWRTAPASIKAKLAESIANLINSSLVKDEDDFLGGTRKVIPINC